MPRGHKYGQDDETAPLLSSPAPNTSSSPGTAESTTSCCGSLRSYVPIEPVLIGYTFARVIVVVLTGFYFFDQASHMYGDPSMDSLNPCGKNGSGGHPDATEADNVQKETFQLAMVGSFSNFMTALIPTIFVGPATDRVGRRLGFVLPILGTIARGIVFLFVLGTGASVYYIYIGTVMEGLGGGFGTFLMTTVSAAADVTTPGRQRGLRICIIEAIQVFSTALATVVAGQWRRESYTYPVILAGCVGVVTLIYSLFFWPETLQPSSARAIPSIPDQQTPGTATQQADRDSTERRALLSGAGSKVLPQEGNRARSGRELSAGQGRASSRGQGYGAAFVDRVRVNADVAEAGHSINGEENATHEGQARNTFQSNYVSFPPTGRHSNPVRHGSQRASSYAHPASSRGDLTGDRTDSGTTAGGLSEAPPTDTDCCPSCCALALKNVRESWRVYTRVDARSHPERRTVLVLCFVCFLLTVAVNFSKPGVETVFRLSQLCWTAVTESTFESAFLVQHWAFILAMLYVLQKRLKFRDVSIAIIASVSAICAPLIFMFVTLPDIPRVTANVLVYVSATSGTWARALIPMLRSMSSSVVSPDEQGTLFTSYACVELAGAAVFDLLASQVYKATVHVWKGIIFVIFVLFFVVVLTLLIILSRVQKRSERNDAEHHGTFPQPQRSGRIA